MEATLEVYSIDNNFEKRGLKRGDRVVVDPDAPLKNGNIVLCKDVDGSSCVSEVELDGFEIHCGENARQSQIKTGYYKVVGIREL